MRLRARRLRAAGDRAIAVNDYDPEQCAGSRREHDYRKDRNDQKQHLLAAGLSKRPGPRRWHQIIGSVDQTRSRVRATGRPSDARDQHQITAAEELLRWLSNCRSYPMRRTDSRPIFPKRPWSSTTESIMPGTCGSSMN